MNLEQKITRLLDQDEKDLKTTFCLLLVAVTAAVYWQVAFHEFLNYDDHLFVYQNSHVSTGMTWANVKWAFTTLDGDASYWHPLTWLSLQLDCQLFGLRPGALHLTNLLFHLANTALLFIVLDKLTGEMWRSLMVAALFALHPLHIETVAWVAERKGLVCTFFWLLTSWAYIGYARRPGFLRYLLVFILCAASLMSKPFAVTLPFTLLLLDFWPLQRLRFFRIPHTVDSKPTFPTVGTFEIGPSFGPGRRKSAVVCLRNGGCLFDGIGPGESWRAVLFARHPTRHPGAKCNRCLLPLSGQNVLAI